MNQIELYDEDVFAPTTQAQAHTPCDLGNHVFCIDSCHCDCHAGAGQ